MIDPPKLPLQGQLAVISAGKKAANRAQESGVDVKEKGRYNECITSEKQA